MIILTGGLVFLGKLVPGGFMPSEDMGYLMVNIQLPDAASMQRTDEITEKVEKIIENHEEVEYITAVAGFSCSPTACHPMPVSFSSRSRIGACGSRPPTSWWRQ
jgi:HAE1 family hydrophobic/amphiphilic exporter-1